MLKRDPKCNAKKTTKTKKKEDPDQMGGGTEPGSLKNYATYIKIFTEEETLEMK